MKRLLLAVLVSLSPLVARSARGQEENADLPPPPPPPDDADSAQPPPPPDAQPPAQPPAEGSFDQQLAPYGRWVVTPDYGRVWVPSNIGPDWQPYADGRWVDTSYGWTFVSPLPWGPIVFHYGRWGWRDGFGWYWVPGYRWAPAWVSWRWVRGYACWAPLGPRGYVYGRGWPGWVVVPHAHFTAPIRRWAIPRAKAGVIVSSARQVRTFPSYRAAPSHGAGHRGRRR